MNSTLENQTKQYRVKSKVSPVIYPALKVVSARLANQILTATVKQRYLMIFAEVITPLQVEKLYKIDEKVSREAHKVVKYRQSAPVK
jgi:hypothetical protein